MRHAGRVLLNPRRFPVAADSRNPQGGLPPDSLLVRRSTWSARVCCGFHRSAGHRRRLPDWRVRVPALLSAVAERAAAARLAPRSAGDRAGRDVLHARLLPVAARLLQVPDGLGALPRRRDTAGVGWRPFPVDPCVRRAQPSLSSFRSYLNPLDPHWSSSPTGPPSRKPAQKKFTRNKTSPEARPSAPTATPRRPVSRPRDTPKTGTQRIRPRRNETRGAQRAASGARNPSKRASPATPPSDTLPRGEAASTSHGRRAR